MKTVLVVLFVAIIVLTIYLPLSNNEKFVTCLPNTYKGTPLQSFKNLFKGGCFIELDENYKNEIRDNSVPLNQGEHLPNGTKYCFNSMKAPAIYSHSNETKPWCYFPSN